MFPLHEGTIYILALLAIAGGMAAFTALRGWIGLWRTAAILGVGLAWPWPVAAFLGLNGYTIAVALYLSAWTAGGLLVGLAWGLLAGRIAGPIAVLAVAITPTLAGAAYLLERQRVPNAACATEVEFLLGDLRLAVPRALGLRAACTGAEQAWTGAYSAWPGAKPDVRALCRVTENGRRPVDVAHAWMAFSNVRKELEGACRGSSGSDPSTEACTAISQTEPTVVQFYARQDGIPAPSLGHFRTETITEARAAGEAEGVRCKASTNGPRTRYCTAWLELTPEVLAISTVKLGPERDGEDPPSDTAILVRVLTRGLAFR